jgi:hypothetical protein
VVEEPTVAAVEEVAVTAEPVANIEVAVEPAANTEPNA